MLETMISFLLMLNPFALFVYLSPIMDELENKQFNIVLLKASFISFIIYSLFMLGGEFVFNNVFRISYESYRIFGGIIIFSFAYQYIVRGEKSLIHIKENLDDLASEISLPFMVGAGSISLSILIGYNYSIYVGFIILGIVMILNFFVILLLKYIKDSMNKRRLKTAYDKNINILMRINGFFIGAIGVDMIVSGIRKLFTNN